MFSPWNISFYCEWGPWNIWGNLWYFHECNSRLVHSTALFLVMCVCVCVCFFLACGFSLEVIVRDGSSRCKIKVCEHWQGFPGWTAPDDLFKWHSFQGNWSTSSSAEILTHGVTFHIPEQPWERLLFLFNSLPYVCVSPADKQDEKLNDYTVSKALQAAD